MPILRILQGLPASGKTTYAKNLQKSEPGWKRVNLDDLRSMIDNGVYSHDNEKLVQSVQRDVIYKFLRNGLNVVVDNTHMNKDAIKRLHALAEDVGDVKLELVPFDVPKDECVRRNVFRMNAVPEEVIHRMAEKQLSAPSESYYPARAPAAPLDQDYRLPKAIICDLDGTMALLNGRNPYDASTCDRDLPNWPVVRCIGAMNAHGYRVIFMSGREDLYRPQTELFLSKHCPIPHLLFMRRTGDARKDSVVKRELFDAHVRGKYNVAFVLDDRNQVVQMWRDIGLACFQVNYGAF